MRFPETGEKEIYRVTNGHGLVMHEGSLTEIRDSLAWFHAEQLTQIVSEFSLDDLDR